MKCGYCETAEGLCGQHPPRLSKLGPQLPVPAPSKLLVYVLYKRSPEGEMMKTKKRSGPQDTATGSSMTVPGSEHWDSAGSSGYHFSPIRQRWCRAEVVPRKRMSTRSPIVTGFFSNENARSELECGLRTKLNLKDKDDVKKERGHGSLNNLRPLSKAAFDIQGKDFLFAPSPFEVL
jgi:hypothetical protein